MTRSVDDLAADVREGWRDLRAALIAVKGHLDEPYPDDPRWTPWTRFVERALVRLDAPIPELVALVGTLTRSESQSFRALQAMAERAEAAEAALADMRRALEAVREECEYDVNLLVCDCDDSDGSICLAHRVLEAAGPAPEEPT